MEITVKLNKHRFDTSALLRLPYFKGSSSCQNSRLHFPSSTGFIKPCYIADLQFCFLIDAKKTTPAHMQGCIGPCDCKEKPMCVLSLDQHPIVYINPRLQLPWKGCAPSSVPVLAVHHNPIIRPSLLSVYLPKNGCVQSLAQVSTYLKMAVFSLWQQQEQHLQAETWVFPGRWVPSVLPWADHPAPSQRWMAPLPQAAEQHNR